MRNRGVTVIEDVTAFKRLAVHWASQFQYAVCLDSNGHQSSYGSFDFLIAADPDDILISGWHGAFERLERFHQKHGDWIFGCLGYDLKNGLEDLKSERPGAIGFPDMVFFRPRRLMILRGNELELLYLAGTPIDGHLDLAEIFRSKVPLPTPPALAVTPRPSRAEYLQRVEKMRKRIGLGDIYEANFCMEFFADGKLDPASAYDALNQISQAPFAAFLRAGSHYLLCTSPERYLRKQGRKIISQPIKGTSARHDDPAKDKDSAMQLGQDPKERSENIMIVDLVRNDLSRTAAKGSVKVEELCGVYSFRQVHQLISTITSELHDECSAFDALRTSFPMGSMTGAPKISAMQIIEELEATRRGLYSGAVGYITPHLDFDFNVVIRSILYHDAAQYVSFHVGSAITHLSQPEREYEECLLKAAAMMRVLGC